MRWSEAAPPLPPPPPPPPPPLPPPLAQRMLVLSPPFNHLLIISPVFQICLNQEQRIVLKIYKIYINPFFSPNHNWFLHKTYPWRSHLFLFLLIYKIYHHHHINFKLRQSKLLVDQEVLLLLLLLLDITNRVLGPKEGKFLEKYWILGKTHVVNLCDFDGYVGNFVYLRKNQMKRVCQVPAEGLSSDMWSWRKYGQKPIKGSPYPRWVFIFIIHFFWFSFFWIHKISFLCFMNQKQKIKRWNCIHFQVLFFRF